MEILDYVDHIFKIGRVNMKLSLYKEELQYLNGLFTDFVLNIFNII